MSSRRVPAFTLVEMIIVITIITILLTVGALGLRNLAKGSGVSATVPVTEAVFAEARAIAIGKGTNARVLINSNKDDDRYLRFMVVAYLDDDSGKWVAESRGTSLPKGVYFSQDFSKKSHSTGGAGAFGNSDAMDIYGGAAQANRNENLSGSYFYYEYNSEGNITDPGASFIIGVGTRSPGAEKPRADDAGAKNFGGFVIWRKGSTSVFRHPDQIGMPADMSAGDEF
jgi:prepilin-type N-terminal cleavage/methylation domain-containing protein